MPTIYEIKQAIRIKSPYFFSRDTLKFFGQTMKSFKVKKSPQGRTFIYAPIYDGEKNVAYSFREFTGDSLIIPTHTFLDKLSQVLDYIDSH